MFLKEKLYLVASFVDDSIKSSSAVYDITIFKSFVAFEEYVNLYPVVIDTLVLTTDDLQFTSTTMQRLIEVVQSPFVKIKSGVIYLVDETYDLKVVNTFFGEHMPGSWSVYQGKLEPKFVADILSGERRNTIEDQVDIVTYRMRNEEYVRQENLRKEKDSAGMDEKYITDEDELKDIPDEESPVEIIPEGERDVSVLYMSGLPGLERTLMVFIVAQYLSLNRKVLIMEKDFQYHRLSDIVTKAGVPYMQVDIEELKKDSMGVMQRIRATSEKLIVITCFNRAEYDYNFVMDVLETNLEEDLDYMIRECEYDEVPFGRQYTVIMRNTVPDILRNCMALKYDINPKEVQFVGVAVGDLDALGVNSMEMQSIVSMVLEKNGIHVTVIRANGIKLSERSNYDILSVIAREHVR